MAAWMLILLSTGHAFLTGLLLYAALLTLVTALSE